MTHGFGHLGKLGMLNEASLVFKGDHCVISADSETTQNDIVRWIRVLLSHLQGLVFERVFYLAVEHGIFIQVLDVRIFVVKSIFLGIRLRSGQFLFKIHFVFLHHVGILV